MSSLLALFGFTIILENVIQRAWTADFRAITPWYSGASLAQRVDYRARNRFAARLIPMNSRRREPWDPVYR